MSEKMRILIGYDGSDCAEAMLDDLLLAGLPPEADAVVMSVAEAWFPQPPPSSFEIVEEALEENGSEPKEKSALGLGLDVEKAKEFAEFTCVRLRERFPLWQVKALSLYGSPASELIAKADKWHADLIVVGSHGRSAFERLLLGSVSQKVLTESRSNVRVARGRVEEGGSPVRLVLGLDGSKESEKAVREVASRVWPLGTEARILLASEPLTPTLVGHVVPPIKRWVAETNREEREWIEQITSAATRELRAAELDTSVLIREGNPKRVLVEEAESWGADCIFLGSTGFSNRFERFLLGSVSAAVAARAHCSVEVVRRLKGESDTAGRSGK